MTSDHRIPVTVLTGYLGSGKTTLLNRILSQNHGQRIAVIVNEFGEIGIDNQLVIGADEEIFEMNNGCICCSVRADLIRILEGLLDQRARIDHILIETTGIADPGPVAQTFLVDSAISARTKLDSVVAVVDAQHVDQQLDLGSHECRTQIAFADTLLINKADLVRTQQLDAVRSQIRTINPSARIFVTERCQIDLSDILNQGDFDLDKVLERAPTFLDHHAHHHHDNSIVAVGIDLPGELDFQKFQDWFSRLISTRGADIFRSKGILAVAGENQRLVFHGVHMLVETQLDRDWGQEQRRNQITFIGRNLNRDELTFGIQACLCSPQSALLASEKNDAL